VLCLCLFISQSPLKAVHISWVLLYSCITGFWCPDDFLACPQLTSRDVAVAPVMSEAIVTDVLRLQHRFIESCRQLETAQKEWISFSEWVTFLGCACSYFYDDNNGFTRLPIIWVVKLRWPGDPDSLTKFCCKVVGLFCFQLDVAQLACCLVTRWTLIIIQSVNIFCCFISVFAMFIHSKYVSETATAASR